MKVTVLGAGLVGAPMTLDLAKNPAFDVTVVDLRTETLDRLVGTATEAQQADLYTETIEFP